MNPKQHAKRNTVLRVIAFLLIVALVYGALTRLLTVNNATEQQSAGRVGRTGDHVPLHAA